MHVKMHFEDLSSMRQKGEISQEDFEIAVRDVEIEVEKLKKKFVPVKGRNK
jgi:hypothetical protein